MFQTAVVKLLNVILRPYDENQRVTCDHSVHRTLTILLCIGLSYSVVTYLLTYFRRRHRNVQL